MARSRPSWASLRAVSGHQQLTACGETHVSAEAGQFSRWGRGARLTRRVREEPPPGELARVYFDRNATQNAAKRSGSAGAPTGRTGDRRSSPHRENWAAWVLPQAVNGALSQRNAAHPLGGWRLGRCDLSRRAAASPPGPTSAASDGRGRMPRKQRAPTELLRSLREVEE